jgi:DNA-binding response OmpR family regulator
MAGVEVCCRLSPVDTPIIILSAVGDQATKVEA